jgi:hypothetical protein
MTTDAITDQPPPNLPAQDSDYDGAWKEALRKFLRAIKCSP